MSEHSFTAPSQSFDSKLIIFLNYSNVTNIQLHRAPGYSPNDVRFFDTEIIYRENRVNRGNMLLTAMVCPLQFYEVCFNIFLLLRYRFKPSRYRHVSQSNNSDAHWLGTASASNSYRRLKTSMATYWRRSLVTGAMSLSNIFAMIR